MGAPIGNKNAAGEQASEKPFRDALRRILSQDADGKRLRRIADKLVTMAEKGEAWAMREFADRMDGKSHQSVSADVDASLTVEIVRFAAER